MITIIKLGLEIWEKTKENAKESRGMEFSPPGGWDTVARAARRSLTGDNWMAGGGFPRRGCPVGELGPVTVTGGRGAGVEPGRAGCPLPRKREGVVSRSLEVEWRCAGADWQGSRCGLG